MLIAHTNYINNNCFTFQNTFIAMTTVFTIAPNNTDDPRVVSVSPLNTTDDYNGAASTVWNDSSTTDEYEVPSFVQFGEYKAAELINNYYLYLVCSIGVPGNVACIVTLTFMKPKVSSALYMMTLAVADLSALALKLSYLLLTKNDVELGDRLCQLIFMLGTASQMYSNWILVAMTLERFIAIWFPFQVKKLCTKKNALFIIVALLVFFILSNVQFLFTFEEVKDPFMSWDCRPKAEYREFVQFVWYWIDGALYAILPIILITILNSLIIYSVRKSSRAQLHLTNRIQKINEKFSQQRQITMMLLTTSIMFLLLVMPNCIFFIAREYWTWKETPLGISQYYLVYQIVFLLSDLNHAVNFYLYCLSGRKFRQKFVELLCCRRKQSRRSPASYVSSIDVPRVAVSSSATNIATVSSPLPSPVKCIPQNGASHAEESANVREVQSSI